MYNPKSHIKFLIKIASHFPKPKLIYFIILIIKILPLIILTHDWNLLKKRGISQFLRKFTLGQAIYISNYVSSTKIKIYKAIVIIVFILFLFSLITPILIFKNYKKNYYELTKIQNKILKILALCYFYVFYMVNQHLYSVFIEVIYEKKNNILYYILLIMMFFIFIFLIIMSILIDLYNSPSYFIETNYFLSSCFTKFNNFTFILPLYQISIQLGYHVKFEKMLYIKNITRGGYVIFYFFLFFSDSNLYVRKFYDYPIKLVETMCFVSCIIEWCTYYDIKNDLTVLIDDDSAIILKLILEFIIGIVIVEFYYKREKKAIKKMIVHLNMKDSKKYRSYIFIKFLNLLYYMDNIPLLTEYINTIFEKNENNNNINNKIDLKKSLKDKSNPNYYSTTNNNSKGNFELVKFLKEKEDFLSNKESHINNDENNKEQPHILKEKFPSLYIYIKNTLIELVEKDNLNSSNEKYIENYFILSLFYYAFDRNYFKAFYIIENLKKSKMYKDSFFCQIRIEQYYYHVKKQYKNFLNKYSYLENIEKKRSETIIYIKNTYFHLNLLNNVIIAMSNIKKTLNCYYGIMNKFYTENDIKYSDFEKMIKKFNDIYKHTKKIIKNILNNKNKNDNNKHKIDYNEIKNLMSNYNIFKRFFENNIKKEKIKNIKKSITPSNKNKTINNNEDLNNITDNLNNYVMVINVEIINDNYKFIIEYITEKLLSILNYKIEDLKSFNLTEIFPKNFSKPYIKYFSSKLKNGSTFLSLNNFFIVDKEKFAYNFKARIITVFQDDGIRLYFNLIEKKNCFIIANKKGKIINISKMIENNFYLNSKIFTKTRINFDDMFLYNFLRKDGNNKKEFNVAVIYNNIFKFISDNTINDISQKIGEEDFSMLIIKLKEIINIIKNENYKIIVKYYYKKLNIIDEKEYYVIDIKIFNNESKNYIFDINKEVNIKMNKNKSSIVHNSKNNIINNDNNVNTTNNKLMIYDLKYRIYFVKTISIEIINIFYQYDIKDNSTFSYILNNNNIMNTNISSSNIINSDINKNSNTNISNINNNNNMISIHSNNNINPLNNYNQTEGIKLKEIINIDYPQSILFRRLIYLIFVIIFLILIIFLGIFKINLINKQYYYISIFSSVILLRQFSLNINTNILFNQLHYNNIQKNFFWENFSSFTNETSLLISDYYSFLMSVYNFYQNNINELNEFFTNILTKSNLFIFPLYNGSKHYFEHNYVSISYEIRILRYILNLDHGLPIIFNSTSYFNSTTDNNIYLSEKSTVIIIENYITIYYYFLMEFSNAINPLCIQDKFKGQTMLTRLLLVVSITYSLYIIINMILFIRKNKFLFIRNFITFNQIIFFHTYLMKKTNMILDYINNNNELNDNNNFILYNKIKFLNNDNDEMFIIEKSLHENSYENISQIRLKAFKIFMENSKNSFKYLERNNHNFMNPSIFKLNILNKENNSNIPINTTELLRSKKLKPMKSKSKKVLVLKNQFSNNNINSNNFNNNNNVLSTNGSSAINSKNTTTLSSNQFILKKNDNSNTNYTDNGNDQVSGHKLLKNHIQYLSLKIVLPLFLMVYIFINVLDLKISNDIKKNTNEIFKSQITLFSTIFNIIELIHLHIFTILKNEVINVNYTTGTEYSIECIENNEVLNNKKNRNIFNELQKCFPNYLNSFMEIINGKLNTKLSKSKNLFNDLESENFCNAFINSFELYKETKSYIPLNSLSTNSIETIFNQCENIGNGFNTKGINNIISSIYTEIINLYNDYINDQNKTEEKNYIKLNEENLIILEKEIKYILSYLAVSFISVFELDFNDYKNYNINILVYFISADIVIIILITFYDILCVKNYSDKENDIIFFTDKLGNTIMF